MCAYVRVEVDEDEVLDEMDADAIIDYLKSRGVSVNLSEDEVNVFSDDFQDKDLVQHMMNYLLFTRTHIFSKEDFIEKITELINDNYYQIKRN